MAYGAALRLRSAPSPLPPPPPPLRLRSLLSSAVYCAYRARAAPLDLVVERPRHVQRVERLGPRPRVLACRSGHVRRERSAVRPRRSFGGRAADANVHRASARRHQLALHKLDLDGVAQHCRVVSAELRTSFCFWRPAVRARAVSVMPRTALASSNRRKVAARRSRRTRENSSAISRDSAAAAVAVAAAATRDMAAPPPSPLQQVFARVFRESNYCCCAIVRPAVRALVPLLPLVSCALARAD